MIGKTPVVHNTGARYSINMFSAVTAQGVLRFTVREGTVNAEVFIDFRKRLLHDAAGPVYLIFDGHPAHRAKATKFVAATDGQLRLFFLPGYSNPDEWVWKNVKHDRIGKTGKVLHRSVPVSTSFGPPSLMAGFWLHQTPIRSRSRWAGDGIC